MEVKCDKLVRQRLKTKAAPDIAIGNELILGLNEHRGVTKKVSLNAEQRSRHMYIVGASGTGKSTLMLNCIRQDIESGQGMCVLDPHGDLIEQALAYIPESRIDNYGQSFVNSCHYCKQVCISSSLLRVCCNDLFFY